MKIKYKEKISSISIRIEITPLPQVYNDEIQELSSLVSTEAIAQFISPFDKIKSTLYRIRSKTIPKLPKTTEEIIIPDNFAKTLDQKERFLLFDTKDVDRIIAFCSMSGLSRLSQADQWHIDATFKASPKLYYQLLIIHAYIHETTFPCVYILFKK
ncbi:unnamed protein product [Brachionus calyciflorus]|uniref:Uncharacterized protein n=1 Tax=Brachionus calyciflorus TaxID=104777 RepID=A0A814RMQ4_9BILA|nr:unnamed protein product [Brachionus calyciflorus]